MARPKISIRSVLIAINLAVLLLPLAGIQLLRLYESALVRQTESALTAQAAFIAAFYRNALREELVETASVPAPPVAAGSTGWVPQPAQLDLATSAILPPFPNGEEGHLADPVALRVGERLIPVLKDAQLVTLAGIRVVDPQGVIVASTGEDVGQSIAVGEEVASALQGVSTSRLRTKSEVAQDSPLDSISRASGIRVFVASPILAGQELVGAVMLSRTPPSIVNALYAKRWLLLQALALLVLIVLGMSLLTFRLIANPIRKLSAYAARIAQGGWSQVDAPRLREPRTKELADLQSAITEMAQALEQRARYLQGFSRQISHEFKTPLAGIRGAVEVLEDHGHDMPAADRHRFLANIAADADRLHRLTQRLMELSRAELGAETATPVDVAQVVTQTVDQFAAVPVHIGCDLGALPAVLCNAQVLQAVLEILLENAAQHGATQIDISAQASGPQTVSIAVCDNGGGITAANRERVFEPFFTTQREQGGTGMGLSIARALLQPLDAQLYLQHDSARTTFVIEVPKSPP